MHCTLYIKAEHNKNAYYVPTIENVQLGFLNQELVRAVEIMLNHSFIIGNYVSLKEIVDRIKDKKSEYGFMIFFLEDREEEFMNMDSRLSQRDFYRACNVMEELYRLSKNLDKHPLDIFAIRFE